MAINTGMFPDTIVTNAGKKMIVQSQNGSTLTITRVALGDGVLGNNEDQQELTAIKSEKLSADISQFEDLGNGQFTLTFTIDNSTIEKGFWHREIGIMAKVDDSDEQLYAYTNAGSAASFLYDKSTPIQARTVKIDIVIGSAENVNVTIDKSVVYTTHKDLEEHNSDTDAHAALVEKLNQGTAALLEQNNLYHVEATGYGIVSGCEPSINGLTVTVSAGVIHTADGRRVEVPEQSITLDAADATKPRIDLVYMDASSGALLKKAGNLGTSAVAGSSTYTITTNFVSGDTVEFDGVTFTCTDSTTDATNFAVGSDIATSAANLTSALNQNGYTNLVWEFSSSDATVTIKEVIAGDGNTPPSMTTTGTGVITLTSTVSSVSEENYVPAVEGVITVAEVRVDGNSTNRICKDSRLLTFRANDVCEFLFPQKPQANYGGDFNIIKTSAKTMMIDVGATTQYDYIMHYFRKHGIKKVDVVLITHYHSDHYGNISNLLNQSEVDFSGTQWLIPANDVKDSDTDTDRSAVLSALSGRNYRELSKDETMYLSDTVTVDFMCTSPDVLTYAKSHQATYGNTGISKNHISIYALIRHKNIKALYTGDGYQPEIAYVVSHYDLPKLNILKVFHHGGWSPVPINDAYGAYNEKFFQKTCPDYAVYNAGYNDYWDGKCRRDYTAFPAAYGSKVLRTLLDDVELISDGTSIINQKSKADVSNYAILPDYVLYVDASAVGVPDGSKAHPYNTLVEAFANLPRNLNEFNCIYVKVASGSYGFLAMHNIPCTVRFNLSGDVTITNIYIDNCLKVSFDGTLVTNHCDINSSNVVFATLNIVYNKNSYLTYYSHYRSWFDINNTLRLAVTFVESNISIFNSLIVDGTNAGDAAVVFQTCIAAYLTKLSIATISINACKSANFDRKAIITGGNATVVSIYKVNKFVSDCILVTPYQDLDTDPTCPSVYMIYGYDSSILTSEDFTGRFFGKGREPMVSARLRYTKIGNTATRPDSRLTYYGMEYYDTTLGHLLIWNGSAWLDTATNATV